MAIPFIPLAVIGISALTGLGTSAKALSKNSQAKNTSETAQAIYDRAKIRLENARTTSNKSLEELGRKKLTVLEQTMNEFITVFDQVHDIQLSESTGISEAVSLKLDKQSVLEIRELGAMASSVLSGVAGGVGAGALTAFGAYSATMTFAAASTGTAIASLSGAAATNATLAFLGGGAVAAGGGGIALGTAVLGGVAAAPAFAILGISMNAAATKKLEDSRSMLWEAKEVAEGLNVVTSLCNGVSGRAKMYTALLSKLDAILSALTQDIKQIIVDCGCNYELYDEPDQNTFAMVLSVAGAIKRILDTPILNEDGSLTESSVAARDEVTEYLKAINHEICDELPAESVETKEQIDYAALLEKKATELFGDENQWLLDDRRISQNIVSKVCRRKVGISDVLCFWDMTIRTNGAKGFALTTKGLFCNSDSTLCAEYTDVAKTEISYSPGGIYIFTTDGKRHYQSDVFIDPFKLKQFLDYATTLFED